VGAKAACWPRGSCTRLPTSLAGLGHTGHDDVIQFQIQISFTIMPLITCLACYVHAASLYSDIYLKKWLFFCHFCSILEEMVRWVHCTIGSRPACTRRGSRLLS